MNLDIYIYIYIYIYILYLNIYFFYVILFFFNVLLRQLEKFRERFLFSEARHFRELLKKEIVLFFPNSYFGYLKTYFFVLLTFKTLDLLKSECYFFKKNGFKALPFKKLDFFKVQLSF